MKKTILLLLLCVSCNQAKEKSIPIKSPKLLTPIFLGFSPLMDNSEFESQVKKENIDGNLDGEILKLDLNDRNINLNLTKKENSLNLHFFEYSGLLSHGNKDIQGQKKIIKEIIGLYNKKYTKSNVIFKNELKSFVSTFYYTNDSIYNNYEVFRDSLKTIIIHYEIKVDYHYELKKGRVEKKRIPMLVNTNPQTEDEKRRALETRKAWKRIETDPNYNKLEDSMLTLNINYFYNQYLDKYIENEKKDKLLYKTKDSINKEKIKRRLLKNNNSI